METAKLASPEEELQYLRVEAAKKEDALWQEQGSATTPEGAISATLSEYGKAAPDAVLAYHSALEAHGVAHSPARVATFLSSRKVTPFDVGGYQFRRGPDLAARAGTPEAGVTHARVDDMLVPVTTRERTLADCLKRLDLGGGVEEVLRSVGMFTTLSSAALTEYVVVLNSPTLAARVGWLMSLMAEAWLYDPEPLEHLRRLLGRGTYWLQRRRPGVQYEFVAAWRLYVPAAVPFHDWLRG